MEFPDLGEHCSLPECGRLDFVPFLCSCAAYFCREHYLAHCLARECEALRREGEADAERRRNLSGESVVHRCEHEDGGRRCRNSSLVRMPCEECTKHFCIVHRFHKSCYDLNSESILAERKKLEELNAKNEKTRLMIEKEVTLRLRHLENTPKAKTALKVQLMRIKSKAIGEKDVPAVDRAYFSIKKPADPSPKDLSTHPPGESITSFSLAEDNARCPAYVSKRWSLGRALDSLASKCSVRNENNVAGRPKLCLFRASDGMCVSNVHERIVEELLGDGTLADGERLDLEYVEAERAKAMREGGGAYFLALKGK